MSIKDLNKRVSAARAETEARGETFYAGASRVHLASFPPKERWDDWVELDSKAWPERVEKRYMLVPTTCFNCESACGLLAYIDKDTFQVRKFEGNPEHPGSRGRNCAKGPATLNQITDPDRILYPLKRSGARGEGKWERVSWDEAMDDVAARIRKAMQEKRNEEIMYHVGRPGEDGFTERMMAAWGCDAHNSHTNICSSEPGPAISFGPASTAPARSCSGQGDPSDQLPSGDRPLLQPPCAAHHGGQEERRQAHRLRHAPVQHRHPCRLLAGHPARFGSGCPPGDRQPSDPDDQYNKEFVRRWWNWQEYLQAEHPELEPTFETFTRFSSTLYESYTFEYAAAESGIDADVIQQIAETVAKAGTRLATHNWRSAGAGNEGGWQVARTLMLLNRFSVPSPRKAAPIPTPGTSSSHARSICRGIRSIGTSSPGRWSTR